MSEAPSKTRAVPRLRRINLHAAILRYLVEISRLGSIRRASARLNVASSAINRQVLRLERELGTRIFDRLPSGMRLTPAGELLLQHVRGTLQNFDKLLAEMDGLRGIRSGHVTLAALDSLLVAFIPHALGRGIAPLSGRYLHRTCRRARSRVDQRRGRRGRNRPDLRHPDQPAFAACRQRARRRSAAIMAPDHPLATRKSLTFADLESYPVTVQSDSLPSAIDTQGEFAGFRNRATARFTSNSIEFQRGILRSGLAVACLTRLGFQRELAAGTLVWVPLASAPLQQLQIGMFIPQRRTLSPAATLVVATLTRQLQQLAEED